MARISLLLLLLLVSGPLFALSVGPEIPLSSPVIEPMPFCRNTPRVASNGDGFLVVWVEGRWPEIRAARVDRHGALVDAQSFVIAFASDGFLSVASDGRDYVVAYKCNSQTETSVCLARVDAATGAVFQTGRLVNGYEAAVASTGNGYLVAYRATRGPFLQSAVIDAVALRGDGSVAGAPFRVTNGVYAPAIAANGDRYLILSNTYSSLKTVLVDASGTIGRTETLTDGAPSTGPASFGSSVASDGEDFLVAWHHNGGVVEQRYVTELRLRPVSGDGVAGEARSVPIRQVLGPDVTWTGSRYLVSFTQHQEMPGPSYPHAEHLDVRGVTVTKTGDDATPVVFAGSETTESGGAAAFNGVSTLVVWTNLFRLDASEIEGRLLPNGELPAEEEVPTVYSRSVTHQESIAAARIGGRTVTAWAENRGPRQVRKVFVQRLDERGLPLDGPGIAAGDSARDQIHPALGGSALAWVETDLDMFAAGTATVYLRFFGADGQLQPAIALGKAALRSRVSVAAAGTTHLVVWEAPGQDIVAARVSSTRGLLDEEPFFVADAPRPARNPAVASDGFNFFLAWNVEESPSGCGICFIFHSLHAAAVSRFGVVTREPFEVAGGRTTDPKLVWNGSEYALFWARSGNGDAETTAGAFAQAFGPSGDLLGAPRRLPADGAPHAVAWLGDEYLAAFDHPELPRWISLVRLDRDFDTLATLPVYSRLRPQSSAMALAPRDDGSAILAYLSGTYENRNSSRAVARRIAEDAVVPRRRAVR